MRTMAGLALVILLAAIVSAPLLGPAGLPVYAAFSWICHQRPERSWHLAGYPLAVCVRCFGIYIGALAGWAAGRDFSRRLFLISVAMLGADWLVETVGWLGPRPITRYIVGFIAGFALIPVLQREHPGRPLRSKWIRKEVRA